LRRRRRRRMRKHNRVVWEYFIRFEFKIHDTGFFSGTNLHCWHSSLRFLCVFDSNFVYQD
jgi:hypothetical protein